MALFLVLLLSIESFGAIVSDNDGSAFITKAEFDSLKNDFQAQIDSYNTSIDNKIDGAIAAYLAGINMAKEEVKKIIFNDWKEGVICLNYKPSITWGLCNLDLSFTQNIFSTKYEGGGYWQESGNMTGSVKYTKPNKQLIYVCDAGILTKGKEVAASNDPKCVMWKGRSVDYQDKLTVSQTYQEGSYYYQGVGGVNMRFNNWGYFSTGYWENLSDYARTIWQPKARWQNNNSSYTRDVNVGSKQSASVATEVKLDANSAGDNVTYKHIVTWTENFTDIRLADSTWLKHLTTNPYYNASNYPTSGSGMSVSGSYYVVEGHTTKSNSGQNRSGSTSNYKGDNTTSISRSIPVIGLLSKSYKYDTIYQHNDKIKVEIGKDVFESADIPVLSDGFPLLAAKKDEEITWEPRFYNTTSDIYLRLCVNEFNATDGLKSSNTVRCKDLDNKSASGENNDYFVVKSGSSKVRWKMPKDGIVYAKWKYNTSSTGNYEIRLDIPNCNTYKVKAAE